jgi:hypothetical protein
MPVRLSVTIAARRKKLRGVDDLTRGWAANGGIGSLLQSTDLVAAVPMKIRAQNRTSVRFSIAVILVAVVFGLAFKKSLLILYYRNAMVRIWHTEFGISQPKGLVVSVRQFFNLPVTSNRNPQATIQAFAHREALVRLGYFTKQRFTFPPVTVATPEYKSLCDKVAGQSGQTPTAQFEYDQPTAPTRVLGLVVYATPAEMPRWEQFIADFRGHRD